MELKTPDYFLGYGDIERYKCVKVVGKGGYGVVFSSIDTLTGETVAIKKIKNVFSEVPRAILILREIKFLKLLRHPNIAEFKSILVPPSSSEFADVFVVLELMDLDLDNVVEIRNLTPDHYRFIMYQILRVLKFMHAANVYHLDLKPKNVLIDKDFKLKVCDFGLSRVFFTTPSTEWRLIGRVGTGPYRAPEICGLYHYSKYMYAIDIWSAGCIFAEMLTGKRLFSGNNDRSRLEWITALLGKPSADAISEIYDVGIKQYLTAMPAKDPVPFAEVFPNSDPLAIPLLQKLLAFDPKHRPTAEEALADDYFKGLMEIESEPSLKPISRDEFAFESQEMMTIGEVRKLMYTETLVCHQQMLREFVARADRSGFDISPGKKQTSVQRSQLDSSAITPKRTKLNQNEKSATDPVLGNVMSTSKEPPCEATANPQPVPLPNESGSKNVTGTSNEESQEGSVREEGLGESSLKQPTDAALPTQYDAPKEAGKEVEPPVHASSATKPQDEDETKPRRAKKTPKYLDDYMV